MDRQAKTVKQRIGTRVAICGSKNLETLQAFDHAYYVGYNAPGFFS